MTCRDVTHFDDTGLAPDGAATTATTEPAPSPEALDKASAAEVTTQAAGVRRTSRPDLL